MRRKIEAELRAEADRFVPDARDAIKRRVGYIEPHKNTERSSSARRRRRYLYAAPIAAALILAVVLTLVFTLDLNNTKGGAGSRPPAVFTATVVRVDINPSVKFAVGEAGKVTRQDALNKDGAILLINRNFVGTPIETAAEEVVGLASKLGYLSEGKTVRLKVLNDDADVESALMGRLNKRIAGKLTALNAKEVGVVAEGKNEVAEYLVTVLGYSEADAERMSADELEDVLEDRLDDESAGLGDFEQQIADGIGQFLKKCAEDADAVIEMLKGIEPTGGVVRLNDGEAQAVAEFVATFSVETDVTSFEVLNREAFEELVERIEEDAEETREAIDELENDPGELSDVLEDFYDRYKIYLKNNRKTLDSGS